MSDFIIFMSLVHDGRNHFNSTRIGEDHAKDNHDSNDHPDPLNNTFCSFRK